MPVNPALHLQLNDEWLPIPVVEFAGQATHAPGPMVSLYSPVPHGVHNAALSSSLYDPAAHAVQDAFAMLLNPPLGPSNPELHRQLLKLVLPVGDTA